jgi:hypothetical protein
MAGQSRRGSGHSRRDALRVKVLGNEMNANTSLMALLSTLAASCVTSQEPPSSALVSAQVEALEGPWPQDVLRDAQLRDVDFVEAIAMEVMLRG